MPVAEMPWAVSVEQQGDMLKTLDKMAGKYEDIRPLALGIMSLLRESCAKNIYEGGRPAWQPLSQNTLAYKKLMGYPSKILVATGGLAAAVGNRGAAGNISEFDGELIRAGVKGMIAKWLQQGTKPYVIVPRGKGYLAFQAANGKVFAKKVHHPGLPPRPFIVIQPDDWKQIKALIKEWADSSITLSELN